MPLSEREQKILDEMEKSLATEDPRFAHDRHARRNSSDHAARAKLAISLFAAGFALLLVFFLTRLLLVGLVAFGGMVAGIVLLASPVSALMSATKERASGSVRRSVGGWDDNIRRRFRRR